MSKKEAWRKFLVPEANSLNPPRRRQSLRSFGPRELGLRERIVYTGGPEEFVKNNPHLFATGNTSRDEGYAYWALVQIIGKEGEIGKNGLRWFYQSKIGGGSNRPGGAVVDFIIEGFGRNRDIGIRIVTSYRHTQAGSFKRATDFEQQFALLDNDIDIVDVESKNYLGDKTGRAAIVSMTRAIERQADFSSMYIRFQGV